jgi:hypothetical protein
MAGNRQPPDLERIHNPGAGHERSDVNVRLLSRLGIIFVLGGIATLFLIWFVFDAFLGREQVKGPPPSPGLDVDARRLPPEPRLQAAPILDLARMRAAEEQIMNGYGWLDRSGGVVRIPVARAMDLIARENLPARNPAGPQATSNATVPTESGLGPIMTQVGGPLSPNRAFPPDQPLEIRGTGNPRDGRQAGGPPTPPELSLANTAPAGEALARGPAATGAKPPANQQEQK